MSLLVLTPSNVAESRDVEPSTTVGELLQTLVDEGKIQDPDEVRVLDDRSQEMEHGQEVGELRAINFMTRLAGA